MSLLASTVIAVGGGKGGVGKSFIASNLACALAMNGLSVVLVDADLAGANIHLLFGIRYPEKTLTDYLKKKAASFSDILLPTPLPKLRLICGASDLLEIANPQYAQKQKLINEIARLDTDVIVIDIGAGASLNNLDFFNAADIGVIVATPSPTSLQNAYSFIKMAVHRRVLGLFSGDAAMKKELAEAFGNLDTFKSMKQVIAFLEQLNPGAVDRVRSLLNSGSCRLVVNMATAAEGERVAKALGGVAYQFLDIHLPSLGVIGFDASVENSIRKMEPLLLSGASLLNTTFMSMANKLVRDRAPADARLGGHEAPSDAGHRMESSSRVQLCMHDEVLCQGTRLHVQTEDLGMEKAQIVSLVFSGGQILYSRKSDYHELIGKNELQYAVAERVKTQHHGIVSDIQDGLLRGELADRKGPTHVA